MVEIGIGMMLAAAAFIVAAVAIGAMAPPAGVDLFPLVGWTGTAFVLALAGLLVAAGLTRRAIARNPERSGALRAGRLTTGALLLVAACAIGLPLVPGPFNLVRIAGVPGGYYWAAQGGLVALVVVAFWWAARRNRIEAEQMRP